MLVITGDEDPNAIAISRTAGGDTLVNGAATGATLSNCDTISVTAAGGDDLTAVSEHVGVESVRLGELAKGFGEVSDRAGVATTAGSKAASKAPTAFF